MDRFSVTSTYEIKLGEIQKQIYAEKCEDDGNEFLLVYLFRQTTFM